MAYGGVKNNPINTNNPILPINEKIKNEIEENDKTREKELPELTVGDNLNLLQLLPSQKFTESPARFTEATLIKVLEEKGIGRSSTYSSTISSIQKLYFFL